MSLQPAAAALPSPAEHELTAAEAQTRIAAAFRSFQVRNRGSSPLPPTARTLQEARMRVARQARKDEGTRYWAASMHDPRIGPILVRKSNEWHDMPAPVTVIRNQCALEPAALYRRWPKRYSAAVHPPLPSGSRINLRKNLDVIPSVADAARTSSGPWRTILMDEFRFDTEAAMNCAQYVIRVLLQAGLYPAGRLETNAQCWYANLLADTGKRVDLGEPANRPRQGDVLFIKKVGATEWFHVALYLCSDRKPPQSLKDVTVGGLASDPDGRVRIGRLNPFYLTLHEIWYVPLHTFWERSAGVSKQAHRARSESRRSHRKPCWCSSCCTATGA